MATAQLLQLLEHQRSTTEQLRHANEQLLQNLTSQKKANETLQKSLANHRAATQNQTSADDCAARLHNLQACLEKKHTQKLEEQAARISKSFEADYQALLADKNARAAAEVREFERILDRLLRKSEAAKERTQSLRVRERELGDANERLAQEKRILQASFSAAEAQAGSLRAANSALMAEKGELEQKCSSANAELKTVFEKLDCCQVRSNHLTAELGEVNNRLTEAEATVKEADEVRKLEKFVDDEWVKWEEEAREAAVKEAEEGEREMDGPLGVLEEVNEGLLQPQVPGWREFLFWLLQMLFGLVVLGMAAISADHHRRRTWLEGGEDPWLDLSRGMYGV